MQLINLLHPLHVLLHHPIRGGGLTVIDISLAQDKSIVMWYDAATTTQYWYSDRDVIYMNPNSSKIFDSCYELTSLNISNWDTSNATNMSWMFSNCLALTSLDVSHFDTSNVNDMEYMFYNCNSLTSLDISHFDTGKVSNMCHMFDRCIKLTSLDVSHFDTSNVTDMEGMFSHCPFVNLDVSIFNISSVTSTRSMFYGCSKLILLDLSNWDTSNVTDMRSMFDDNVLLTNITYGINFTNISLENLTVSDWSNGTNFMFSNCPANKPTWANGTWDVNGTFIKNT